VNELTLPALVGLVGAVTFFLSPWVRRDPEARAHLLKAGLLVGGVDLIVELLGTYTGGWTYHHSALFVFKTVPVELPVLFTSSGVWLGAAHLAIRRLSGRAPSLDKVSLGVIIGSLGMYLAALVLGQPLRMIVFTLPFGLWGYAKLPSDAQRALALLLATATAVADWVIERWAVGRGSYDYAEGFTVETPLTYALLTLGFLGILELGRRGSRDA